jgi:hypothetical protein
MLFGDAIDAQLNHVNMAEDCKCNNCYCSQTFQ